MKRPREHAMGLLEKASHDLIAAKATIATGEALDTVCFHSQQAAEKCLKALLALKDVDYPWKHDLGELLPLVRRDYPEVIALEEGLVALSPYAVEARYDDAFYPEIDEARTALETAQRFLNLAEQIIASAGK
jgi:HEPN domain-containing protein